MVRTINMLAAGVVAGVLTVGLGVAAADARCARLGFSVNDYGKDGPTKDAKSLLDKHIAKWTAERGITRYTTGKKDVKCELFLDFGVFDEHTCRAEATVCWADGAGGAPVKAKDAPAGAAPAKPKVPAKAAPAKSATNPPADAGSPAGNAVAPKAPAPAAAPTAPAPAKPKAA